TENTVVATSGVVDTGAKEAPPIGRPIANTRVYVLDQQLRPVPVGVAGELYIGGDSLARGYLKRPELTSEKFIADPFSKVSGDRLYKTGDVVRYLASGDIDFLGRKDEQVKVRGYRIETGEIEATLCEHENVREACVVAREDTPGEKKLVAYVVPAQGTDGNGAVTNELRRYLSQRLPQYMVPHGFVLLPELPLSPHGKVDRRLLPAPDAVSRGDREEVLVAPRTPAEELLARIWREVLKLDAVGIHDNFFNLGGDSILSIQITARATQAGLRLTPMQLFQHQTIAELAAVGNNGTEFQSEQGEVTGPVPLTPIQKWFFAQDLAESEHFNQAMTLQLAGPIDLELLKQTVQALLAHHDALRLRFEKTATGWQQIDSSLSEVAAGPDPVVPFDFSSLTPTDQDNEIARVIAQLHGGFDLTQPPLLRVACFDLGPSRPGQLFLVIHHLLVDGVSWRTIVEDFENIYAALTSKSSLSLPGKTTSFKKWAEGLVNYRATPALLSEADYWLDILRQASAPLPLDHDKGANTVQSARTINVSLTAEETNALLHKVPTAYRTQINDVLLTVLLQTWGDWTGVPRLTLNLEGHGREEINKDLDVSRTVGWFTTIFPVHLNLQKNLASGEALKAVKEQLRRIPNRGIGYGVLRYLDADGKGEQLRQLRIPEVSFNYLGQFNQLTANGSFFSVAPGPKQSDHTLHGSSGSANTRPHLLDVVTIVADQQLEISFTYSVNRHRQETIERLAQKYQQGLRDLIKHCESPDAGSVAVSDFVAAKLSQKELKKLMSRINRVVAEDVE
ncbi:MAG TPA: condensation domain-containing protein, partial [Pyrinomonadaceae bacterium]|nr:condensation domain-containing protein [Pyrinomonadaceae bacterium]